jgi:hypothetical protein
VQVGGEPWELVDEFHVTAAHAPWLAERAGVSLEHAWTELSAALEGRRAGPVRVGEELRLVRRGEERTLVVMVRVDGLAELYRELSGRLGAPLAPPPAHITLYRRPGGESIGLHDETDLRELTRPLRPPEERAWRAATGLDETLG